MLIFFEHFSLLCYVLITYVLNPYWHVGRHFHPSYFLDWILSAEFCRNFPNFLEVELKMSIFLARTAHANQGLSKSSFQMKMSRAINACFKWEKFFKRTKSSSHDYYLQIQGVPKRFENKNVSKGIPVVQGGIVGLVIQGSVVRSNVNILFK